MAAACSKPDFMVVDDVLDVDMTGAAPGPEWVTVECASKKAYGCGELGEKMFEGLTLYVRRLGCADLNSSLSIGLSDEAVRSIQEELGVPPEFQGIKNDRLPEFRGYISIADRGVLVLHVTFRRWNHGRRIYYIVYDATDASLYMIPCIPSHVEATYTVTPVPARPAGCGGHELALAARRRSWPQPGGAERGRLCLCAPATRANTDDDSTGPWEIKVHGFPDLRQAFSADVMFSLGDKVFWADLLQGVAFSDLRQGGSAVDVDFINLPDKYRIPFSSLPRDDQIYSVKMSRTMGCVEGSIKFVCIDRTSDPRNKMVEVWTLDLDHKQWKEEEGLTCCWKELWTKACLMNGELSNEHPLEPQYPVLMPDGALCLLLPKTCDRMIGVRVEWADYICSFDMLDKSCLCFGQVRNYHEIGPVILPYNFFKNCYPALERKPPTHKRKLSSINKQTPMCSTAAAQSGRTSRVGGRGRGPWEGFF